MFKRVRRFDARLAGTARVWQWLGQLGLVVLGVHLAADQLDDLAYRALASLPFSPTDPAPAAAWAAVALELGVVAKAASALLLTSMVPPLTRTRWWRARSVDSFVLPVFWAITALAGAWSLAMGLEDLMSAALPQLAKPLAVTSAALVTWRLGWTGWRRVVGSLEPGGSVLRGLAWAPLLIAVTGACIVHGLPIWGWLS
jgi:hypothetical protein